MLFFTAERDDMRMRREVQRSLKPRFVPTELLAPQTKSDEAPKLVFAFRHRGNRIASQSVIKLLRDMKLPRKYQGVFLKLTDETKALLAAVEPYVSWGFPSIKMVRDLVFKYGFTKSQGTDKRKKTPISSNIQVEKALGSSNIICIEDIVHELFTVGKNFDAANNFLCQFALQAPKSGWEKAKGLHFMKGGECGYRGDAINELLEAVL